MVSLVSVRRLQRDLGAILQQQNAEWHTYLRTFFRVANLQHFWNEMESGLSLEFLSPSISKNIISDNHQI